MARVIVTGATGFIGANLTRRLLSDGHEVHVLIRPDHAGWRIDTLRSQVSVHLVDLVDGEAVQRIILGIGPQWVFHLAAYGAYPHQTAARAMVSTNVSGTLNLVESSLAAGAEVVVNTGSSSEYGLKDHAPSEEEHAEPNSAYAVTKLSATLLCRDLARRRGVPVPTLRLYSVYGSFEEPTRLIPTLIVRGLAGQLPPLADARNSRDFVYVDDAVDAYLMVATHSHADPGAIYNVGTGTQVSIAELVATARNLLSIPYEPKWGSYPNRAWDTHVWVADCRKLRVNVGWSPRFTLEAGFASFVEWFQRNPGYLAYYREALGMGMLSGGHA